MYTNRNDYFKETPIKFHNSRGSIKRYCGIEIEVLGINENSVDSLIKWRNKWSASIVADGSIDSSYGFEIRTSPAKGSKLIKQIKEVCDILKEGKTKVDSSCGLHVHVDARDFHEENSIEFQKLIYTWAKIEPDMWKLVSKGRRNNDYCYPWFNGDDYFENDDCDGEENCKCFYCTGISKRVKAVTYFKNSKDPNDVYNKLGDNDFFYERYKSLNLSAFRRHKTVENRMMQGSINAAKILKWAAINSKIVDFCKKVPMSELTEIENLNLKKVMEVEL